MESGDNTARSLVTTTFSLIGAASFVVYLSSLPDSESGMYISDLGALSMCGLLIGAWVVYTAVFNMVGSVAAILATERISLILGIPVNGFALITLYGEKIGLVPYAGSDVRLIIAGLTFMCGFWWWDMLVSQITENSLVKYTVPGFLCGLIGYPLFIVGIMRTFFALV